MTLQKYVVYTFKLFFFKISRFSVHNLKNSNLNETGTRAEPDECFYSAACVAHSPLVRTSFKTFMKVPVAGKPHTFVVFTSFFGRRLMFYKQNQC